MNRSSPSRPWRGAAALLLTLSCTGNVSSTPPGIGPDDADGGAVGGTSGRGGRGGNADGGAGGQGGTGTAAGAGQLPLTRLTRDQYDNTVRDLLGDKTHAAQALSEDAIGGSGFLEPGVVALEAARNYWEVAEGLANTAADNLATLTGCEAALAEEACAAKFIRDFGKRAYRRPLSDDEQASYQALYGSLRKEIGHDHRNAMRVLLLTMLQSPFFLYRWELGLRTPAIEPGSGGLVRLDPYQTASRLSYFLWNTMPDAALFTAAETGKLSNVSDVEAMARRMLADPKAKDTLESFHQQWLHITNVLNISRTTTTYKDWSSSLPGSMEAETKRFFEYVVLEGDGKFGSLFTAPFSFIDARLAKLYGVSGVTATSFDKHDLDPAQRGGLLTQASFLAVHATATESHPVKRGVQIWERLLCNEIPPPPANVPPPKPPAPGLSTRERYAEHDMAECARGCHSLFDPIGFALENYDAVGRWRDTDGDKPVDASGKLLMTDGSSKTFTGGVALGKALAESEDARRCVTMQWMRFALGREISDDDKPSMSAAYDAFSKSGFNLRELLVSLTKSKTFLFRRPAPGEVTQ